MLLCAISVHERGRRATGSQILRLMANAVSPDEASAGPGLRGWPGGLPDRADQVAAALRIR